ncbi:MAG TPA: SpoIID/LytB domain-containing protein [Nitrospirota bacterium]|nr:SpoIID/LytB domain-containing protein [Nitrospirota bacterium]
MTDIAKIRTYLEVHEGTFLASMRVITIFFITGLFSIPAVTLGSESIRVAIADNQKTVSLQSSSGLIAAGQSSSHSKKKFFYSAASIGLRPVRLRSSGEVIQVNGKGYRGWVEIRKKKNGLLLVINELDIEAYLKGVVAAEVPPDWEFEALKAQAVASRTYALYQKQSAGNKPYHVLATEDSQVYSGNRGEHPQTVRAVRETRGIVITYHGEVIPAFYHSSCGGHTENAAELWGIDEPYLKGVDCECQEISKYGLWEKRVPLSQVMNALAKQGYRLQEIRDLGIGDITPAGRVKEVSILHEGGKLMVPAEDLRAALGNTQIPSVFFELELSDGEAVFSGRGKGHGVGLCQWGAEEMALRGYDYKAILSHYYPGTVLTKIK